MHAICMNLMRALITLWHGKFKGLDAGSSNYIIPTAIWEVIGQETHDSNKWIPANFMCSLPNIDQDLGNFTAEALAFWMMYIMPHILKNWLPELYYSHILMLVEIMKICIKFGMTCKEHVQLSVDIYEWHLAYEE